MLFITFEYYLYISNIWPQSCNCKKGTDCPDFVEWVEAQHYIQVVKCMGIGK